MLRKVYLGDGVYACFDGYQIILTAEDGIRVTNTIYLEPQVYRALVKFFGDSSAQPEAGTPT